MTATLRLLRIETRRNAGVWMTPVIVLLAWYVLSARGWTPLLWSSTDQLLRYSVVQLAAPAVAGAAAWLGSRERRRHTVDLLATMSRPAVTRRLSVWAGTVVWALSAYVLFAAYMIGRSALETFSGGPAFWPVAVVVSAILAHGAWGYALGTVLPSRFTAPLVAVGAFGAQQVLASVSISVSGGSQGTWVNALSAHHDFIAANVHPWQSLLYASLAVAAFAVLFLLERRTTVRAVPLLVSSVLAVTAVVCIWGNSSGSQTQSGEVRDNFGRTMPVTEHAQAPTVCRDGVLTVCVEDAYAPLMDQAVRSANEVVQPLLGLPGVPMRVAPEQMGVSSGYSEERPWYDPAWSMEVDAQGYADTLVADQASLQDYGLVNEPQLAISDWLRARVKLDTQCYGEMPERAQYPGERTRTTCAATGRFARLSPAQQRSWLEAHYADLRAGKLTLEDLP